MPARAARSLERDVHSSLDCLWHAIALTRNAIQATSLSRRFGGRAEAECRGAAERAVAGLDVGACWGLLASPRALLVDADRQFTEARTTPEPREGELVRAGEARIAEARPLVERAVACHQELVRRHREERHRR
jgi:hypothetical protein